MNLAELYAEANQRNMLARRREPLNAPFDPLRQIPRGMTPPLRVGDVANASIQNAPGIGDVASLLEAYKAWKAGDTTGGLLSGLAALPMVGAIKTYHGSPHKFDKFDMSKIGTGEGAQMYGHGLYFAENPGVARDYADRLSLHKNATLTGGGETAEIPQWLAAQIDRDGIDGAIADWSNRVDEAKAQIKTSPQPWLIEGNINRLQSTLDAMRRMKEAGSVRAEMPQNLYETSLEWPDPAREAADPMGPQHFLDWDKPLSEQKEIVERILSSRSKILKDTVNSMGDLSRPRELYGTDLGLRTGADLMRLLSYNMEGKPTGLKASAAVGRTGIPGITYLDAGSRSAGEGTRNYVIFDDQIPRILKRNDEDLGGLAEMAKRGRR